MTRKNIVFTAPKTAECLESAMVMGLGLLGMFSVQFLALFGANPVIAADLNPARRALALELGADYALDPAEDGFADKVKELTKERGILDLISAKKFRVRPIVSRIALPEEAPEIYHQLCDDPAFPIGTVFDWRRK